MGFYAKDGATPGAGDRATAGPQYSRRKCKPRNAIRPIQIVLLACLAACAGLWWEIAVLVKSATRIYAAAVYAERIESHVAFEDCVHLDVFWAAWRYASIIPSLVASIAAVVWRNHSNACFNAVVVFLGCVAAVVLLMGVWSAWVAQQFFVDTFQILQ